MVNIMKKLIILTLSVLSFLFCEIEARAQYATKDNSNLNVLTSVDNRISIQEEGRTTYIAGFADEASAKMFKSGINTFKNGLVLQMSGALCTGIGMGILNQGSNIGAIMVLGGGILALTGEVMTIVGVVRMNKWCFNGTGLTYSF